LSGRNLLMADPALIFTWKRANRNTCWRSKAAHWKWAASVISRMRPPKHLHELAQAQRAGYRCIVAFVIQMEGITKVRPNVDTQPEFGTALAEAKAAGVRVLFLLCHVGRDSLEIVEQREM
jgi:hypothetical protein